MKINEHYLELEDSYLFSTVARKQREYQQAHPEKKVIRLSIGDVTLPLAPVVIKAMEDAVKEMGSKATFRGYGPEQGYDFLREAVQAYYQGGNGVISDMWMRSLSVTARRAIWESAGYLFSGQHGYDP